MVDFRAISDLQAQLRELGLVPVRILVSSTQVGNIGGGEDNLVSGTLVANTLLHESSRYEVYAAGRFAANANAKQVRLYHGSTVLVDSGSITPNAQRWEIRASVMRRTSQTDTNANASFVTEGAARTGVLTRTAPVASLGADILLKITGEGVATDDIILDQVIMKAIG